MIKKLVVFSAITILFASCLKSADNKCTFTESTVVAPAAEVTALQSWVASNNPAAVQHPSGFFYEITNPGTGTTAPGICSEIYITYTGTLTTGAKFDENLTGTSFALGQLILGWQKGIPLIKKGGSIKLYLPPSLGYGATAIRDNAGVTVIPANSYLVFNIQLLDFR